MDQPRSITDYQQQILRSVIPGTEMEPSSQKQKPWPEVSSPYWRRKNSPDSYDASPTTLEATPGIPSQVPTLKLWESTIRDDVNNSTIEKLKEMGVPGSTEGLEILGEFLDKHDWRVEEFIEDFWKPMKEFLVKKVVKFRWGKMFGFPGIVLTVSDILYCHTVKEMVYEYASSLKPRFIPSLMCFDWDIDE